MASKKKEAKDTTKQRPTVADLYEKDDELAGAAEVYGAETTDDHRDELRVAALEYARVVRELEGER